MSKSFMINRRTALGGAAALAAGAVLPADAQDNKRIVVGTWGGDYSRLLAKNIETPLLAPKGWDVVKDEANDPPRRAKMLAEKSLRRGTSDMQGLSAANMFEMNEQGVVEQIDYTKLANAKNLIPAMKYPYGVGHIYSGKVVLYNPKLVSTPPTGFADTLDPKNGDKLGIIDIQYQYTMLAAGLASGGSMSDVEPGKERLVACKKAGARIYPSNEALAQALKTEEIALCIMWKARAVQWQNAGINIETVAPKEGVPMYV
jgi:putative spermidine/putrescine transport system substrate-binding protein